MAQEKKNHERHIKVKAKGRAVTERKECAFQEHHKKKKSKIFSFFHTNRMALAKKDFEHEYKEKISFASQLITEAQEQFEHIKKQLTVAKTIDNEDPTTAATIKIKLLQEYCDTNEHITAPLIDLVNEIEQGMFSCLKEIRTLAGCSSQNSPAFEIAKEYTNFITRIGTIFSTEKEKMIGNHFDFLRSIQEMVVDFTDESFKTDVLNSMGLEDRSWINLWLQELYADGNPQDLELNNFLACAQEAKKTLKQNTPQDEHQALTHAF